MLNKRLISTILLCLLIFKFGFPSPKPVDLVYPYLDTANSRWYYFFSACHPFGMVSLFPDTKIDGEWNSGYRYEVDTIKDFSHIHEWQLSGVAVMPVTFVKNNIQNVMDNCASKFSHKNEVIYPGYHSVFLERYGIKAELTATNRVGIHRYTFPKDKQSGVVFLLGGHLGPSDIPDGGFVQVTSNEIRGYMVNGPTMRRVKEAPVYFSAVFNRPIQTIYLQQDGKLKKGIHQWHGWNGRVLVGFKLTKQLLLMKVGVSFVSEQGAANNMAAEASGWNFDSIKTNAMFEWNRMLSRIKIQGGTFQQQRRFYTDLAHAIEGRRMVSDADGKYADCTGHQRTMRQLPLTANGKPKFNMYNSDAFWGSQWTLNTLWDLVYPEVTNDFCNSFIQYYKNGGLIPRGPSGGNYTYVMTGASATPFFVSAWQEGIRDFDIHLAYTGLKKNHMPGGMMSKAGYEFTTSKGGGLSYYMAKGYIPYPLSDTIYGMHQDGATITLENSYQDWCLAQLAKTLGKILDYHYYMMRSENYKNLFNTKSRFIVPKDKHGAWQSPFNPLLCDKGFEEANSAQYSWFVPQNLPELFSLMGGKDSAVTRLNRQFELSQPYRFCGQHPELLYKGIREFSSEDDASNLRKFLNNQLVWVNYSNEPSIEMAFIFNYAGAPWLTQYWSRMVVDSAYSKLSPYYGYNGDDDQGLMSSLSVLMKLGLFQMRGGCDENPRFELGSPLFDKITIMLNPRYYKAKTLVIETKDNGVSSPYIQAATLNGRSWNSFYFRRSDINSGVHLILKMGEHPNKYWGNANVSY